MMTAQKWSRPSSIPDLARRLIDLGYLPVPIPGGCKGPTLPGWPDLNMKPEDVDRYFPERGMLIGCLHKNLACFDIDIEDADLAAEIVAEGLRRFPGALERIGASPKSALVLRLDEPFTVRNTEKAERVDGDGVVTTAQVEVRTSTRQMVVYGVHPSTGRPYTWPRGELWETPRGDLPPLTQADAQAFRDWCNDRIRVWSGAQHTAAIIDLGDYRQGIDTNERPSEKSFLTALDYVPPSLGHEAGWCDALMAIHDFYGGSAAGLAVAHRWSSGDSRYSAAEVETKWRSFEAGKGVTYKTVLALAKQHGCDVRALWRADHPQAPDTQFREMTDAEREAVPPALFRPWVVKDLSLIPHPEFVYSDFYARGYTSVTIAPPKVGKSMLGLAEAIDMASGRGFLTGAQRDPLRVVYYNAEDDENVIDSRIAALLGLYGVTQEEIAGRIFPTSGVELPDFYMVSGQEGTVNEALFVSIEKFIAEAKADVLIFDPLQDLSRSPETNEVFRMLGQRLRRMAAQTKVAIGLIHHTRKIAPGMTATIDDARGGSALRGTARFNRLLIGMTDDEGVKAGVENHRHFFRIGDMESNLAPPSSDINRWFEKCSIPTPNGHCVGAVRPWTWPDAFMGLRREDAAAVRSAIAACDPAPRESAQSKDWAGYVVAGVLGLQADEKADKARLTSLIREWVKGGVLAVEHVHDKRNGRPAPVIVAGPNNPLEESIT